MISRRNFITSITGATAGLVIASPLLANVGNGWEEVPPVSDNRLRSLVDAANEAARQNGASYSDVRLTHSFSRSIATTITENEALAIGVRVLVDGNWGFAASPVWSLEEARRLAEAAVYQARISKVDNSEEVDLAEHVTEESGHWTMPVEIDPFEVSYEEVRDTMNGLRLYGLTFIDVTSVFWKVSFIKQDKLFGSSKGEYLSQRTYRTGGSWSGTVQSGRKRVGFAVRDLSPAGVGFEMFKQDHLRDRFAREYSHAVEVMNLPVNPVDVGRYDVLFDQVGSASLLGNTIGLALEMDRAIGIEANATGTSYISDPSSMVGNFVIGSPLLNVSVDRNAPGGVSTVRWDDDGTSPGKTRIVEDGKLTGMLSNREYRNDARLDGNGMSGASAAEFFPQIQCGNISLLSSGTETYDTLLENMESGLTVSGLNIDLDSQCASGLALGRFLRVKNGKLKEVAANAGMLFRTTDLWKNMIAVGSQSDARRFGLDAKKGQPAQTFYYSSESPSLVFKEVSIVDAGRKA